MTPLTSLPRRFKRHLGPVVIRVEEFPDAETERAMGLDSPFDLLGLYRGVALPLNGLFDERKSPLHVFHGIRGARVQLARFRSSGGP